MMIRRSRGLLLRSPSECMDGQVVEEVTTGGARVCLGLLRLLPVLYLAEVGELKEAAGRSEEKVMLGTMDIKDAFLQVPEEELLRLKMPGRDFIVLKNLPGQRIGAKPWFDYFSTFLA